MREGHASMTARRVAAYRMSFQRLASWFGQPDADRRLQEDVPAGLRVVSTPMTRYLRARTAFVVAGPRGR